MIKNSIKLLVTSKINSFKRFKLGDFIIEEKNIDKSLEGQLIIKYRYDPRYSFTLSVVTEFTSLNLGMSSAGKVNRGEKNTIAKCTVSPGSLAMVEELFADEMIKVNHFFDVWLGNLEGELDSAVNISSLEEHYEFMEEIMNRTSNIPEEYFSRAEAEELKSRLDEIEKLVKEKYSEDKQAQDTVNEISNDINFLKDQISVVKKPGWIQMFMVRFKDWSLNKQINTLLDSNIDSVQRYLTNEEE